MSTPDTKNPHVRLSEDKVAKLPVLSVIGVSLIIFLLGIGVAWFLLVVWNPLALVYVPSMNYLQREPRQISSIEQRPFDEGGAAADLLPRQQAELNSYGWVDREANIVRIPIEDAMEWLAEEP